MPELPDLDDPRYLDELGWFVHYAERRRDEYGASYDEERLANSRLLLEEVLELCGRDADWLAQSTVLSVGSGCTADLVAWTAAVKVCADPLLYAYQQLGLLLDDGRTVNLSVGAEELPLVDEFADLVLCRNALDHMPDPAAALAELQRVLRPDGLLFLSVDLGGERTPDEPSVFSAQSLDRLVDERFEVVERRESGKPHSGWRDSSVQLVARRRPRQAPSFDRGAVLAAYEARIDAG
jgi:SAM-dependent methyltransferase